jgi:asparagine synthase (glutamine-hydrolysing)
MGQFLAVFSRHTAYIQPELDRGIRWATALFDESPTSVQRFGFAGVASFERQSHPGSSGHLYTFPEQNSWFVPVGSWIHTDGSTPCQSFRRMVAAASSRRRLADELAKIDGTYCFILGSLTNAHIQLVTDPIGQLNVYSLRLAETVFLSTSALLLAQIGECNWNPLGVREFLATGTVFGNRSVFSDVHKIDPGSILIFDNSAEASRQRYWSLRDHVETATTNEQSLENYGEAVKTGLRGIFNTFDAPVLDLTGGFDSRMVLACARQAALDDGYDTVVAGPSNDPDVVSASRIAARFNLRLHRLSAQPQTAQQWLSLAQAALPLVDGEYDMLEYARIFNIHRQLSARFGASVNGTGGELIRGYWWSALFPRTGKRDSFNARRFARRVYASDPWAEQLLGTRFPDTLLEHFTAAISEATGDLAAHRNTSCLDNIYLSFLIHCWQARIASATNRIWPCLSPLLFRRPIEIAVSASVALRRNGRMARRLLASMDGELARLPMADGYSAMPATALTWPYHLSRHASDLQGRIARRYRRVRNRTQSAVGGEPTLLQQLLALEEVSDLLDPTRMLTAELYDKEKLQATINTITNQQAPAAHVGRLITLESVARLRTRVANSSVSRPADGGYKFGAS